MPNINVCFIPNLPQIPFRNGVGAYEGVVAHATDNYASATNERAYETTNFQNAFVHFFVDWDQILQVASMDYKAYGAGPVANPRFIHVELCQVKNDGTQAAKDKFVASYNNYVYVLAFILHSRKLGVSDNTLWSHSRVTHELGGSTHEDPIAYLQSWSKTWDNVKNDVLYLYNAFDTPPVDVRELKAKEVQNEVEYMFSWLSDSGGNREWALNYFSDVYDIMKSKNLVKDVK